jgi:hypothetical protein
MSIQVNNTDNQLNIIVNGVLDVYNVKTIKSVSRAVDASGNNYISINFIANDKNNSVRIPLSEVTSPVGWTNDTTGAIAAVEDIRDWLSETIDVEISEANDSILIYGFDGVNNQPVSVDGNGQVNTNLHDGIGTAITSTTIGADTGIDVNIIGGVTLEVNLDPDNDGVTVYGSNTTVPVKTDGAGRVAITDDSQSITVDGGTGLLRTTGIIRPTGSGNVSSAAATFYSVSVANVGAANGTVLSAVTIKPGEVLNFSADAINNFFNSFAYNATGTEFIIIYVA